MCSKKGTNHALNLDSFTFNSDFYIFSYLTLSITFLDDKSYECYYNNRTNDFEKRLCNLAF